MYGYIYKTVNTKNNKFYIGKHEVDHYDPAYLGSGKLLQKAIKNMVLKHLLMKLLASQLHLKN